MKEKRLSLRLQDCLQCTYKYKILRKEKTANAKVTSISSRGLLMICEKLVKAGKEILLSVKFPFGTLETRAEVVDSRLKWYVDDKNKKMRFRTQVKFLDLPTSSRAQIINYIYKCRAERRRARNRG
jgi:c-di-GMP-binding flagellar brake protein YcgR